MGVSPASGAGFNDRAERFGRIHAGRPTPPFVRNLATEPTLLRHGGLTFPCTINHAEPDNAWVCSPVATYGSYVIEEIGRTVPPPFAWPLQALCRGYRGVLSLARADQAVAINNWMLSTNLYPAFEPARDADALAGIVDEALRRWPGHAIWFRSLNARHDGAWIAALRGLGFDLLPSRQVYLFDDLPRARHANLRRDLKLLGGTPLAARVSADFGPADFARAEALYGCLYLDKYSRLNPHYTAAFMERWHAAGLLDFWGLCDGGVLQAVVGTFRQGGTITAPIVGYDTALPQALGLYRLLMAHVLDTARRDGLQVNLSAGAARFKRLRGGRPALEYSAVLSRHLPAPRRAALRALRGMAEGIGVPMMRRLEL
ncbi:GNAT family N-acetyltransferase [Pseudoduganella dura]|nr:GNAT family N-acetyltransferase [Pseudoduganella dura]GGX87841.1 hypothetical protein GCM10007386_18360 [Pseudoduganella dura]